MEKLIIIFLLIQQNLDRVFASMKLNENCQNNYFDEPQKLFIQDVILRYLHHCYLIQIRNDDNAFQFDMHFRIPAMKINLLDPMSETMFHYYNTMDRRNMIRFQDQCIVYYLIFHQDKVSIEKDNSVQLARFNKVFLHPSFQSQAHKSYIFIHDVIHDEHEDDKRIESLLLHSSLHNYEHKTWIKMSKLDQDPEQDSKFTFTINTFCYFCKNGYSGTFNLDVSQTMKTSLQVDTLEQIFPDVTSDFNGRALRVTAAMALPFVGILGKSKLRIEGMQAEILKALASTLNFTVILENTSGGLTGSKTPGNTWTGTIGEVLYGRSDIGLNAAPSADRHAVVDFTVSAFYGFLVLVATKPSPFFDWKAIFYPFDRKAWLCICLSTLITVLAYKYFLNCSIQRNQQNGRKQNKELAVKEQRKKISFLQACHFTIGSLLEQGVPFNYFSAASRIYSLFWLLIFTSVVTCAYKSKLFSYLTCPTVSTPPSTFYELFNSHYSAIYKSLGGVGFQFITKSPVPYIRAVGEKMEISMDKYSCMDKTFSEDYVCIIYRAYYDYMSAVRYWKISHKFFVSDYVTPPVGSSWVLKKYSPLLYPLDKNIFLQFEMGLAGVYLDHYIKQMALKSRALAQASNDAKDLFDMNTKFRRESVKEKPLEFANLYVGFLVLFFGSGLSITIFVVEHWRHKNHIRSTSNNVVVQNWNLVRKLYGFHVMRPKQKFKLTFKGRTGKNVNVEI